MSEQEPKIESAEALRSKFLKLKEELTNLELEFGDERDKKTRWATVNQPLSEIREEVGV